MWGKRLKDHTDLFTNFQPVFLLVIQNNAVDDDGTAVYFFQSVEAAQEG